MLFVAACATTFGRLNVLSLDAGGSPQDNSSLINGFCERFGLTSREADVLAYLLAGRSRDYIERELVLSKSTVKTHVRHIYEKTGVHSQQELLDLAEEARAQSF